MNRENAQKIIENIGRKLAEDECDSLHFTLVIWCDCRPFPLFIGGNDDDTPRTLQMLRYAGDNVLALQLPAEGNA
jgi:hypothetical protein